MLNIGIVGIGNISSKHLIAIQNNNGIKLTGAYDTNAQKARLWRQKNNVHIFDSVEQLIDENDVVGVLTPHDTHSALVKKITNKNKWCICEKPLCINANELSGLKNKNKIFIIFQNRYNQAIQEARKRINSGKLGKLNFMQLNTFWYRNPDYYTASPWRGKTVSEGGMLYNQGIHSIDIALYLLDASSKDCKILYAKKQNNRPNIKDTESVVKIVMEVKGVLIDMLITTMFARKNYENSILISGTKDSFKVSGDHMNIISYPEKLSFDDIGDIYGLSHIENYHQILKYIKNGTGNPPLFPDGIDRVKLIERIYKAISD
jgi:predicted dehydrogenase